MKYLISIILTVFGFLTVMSCSDSIIPEPQVESLPVTNQAETSVSEKQARACFLYNQLLSSFRTDSRSGSEMLYPDYYGGAYADSDGNLVVYVCGPDSIRGEIQLSRAVGSSDIKYVSCKYSLNELNNVLDSVTKIATTTAAGAVIASAGINERDNSVEVFLTDYSESVVDNLRKVYDNPALVFLPGSRVILQSKSDTVQIRAGYMLETRTYKPIEDHGTFGFRAYKKSDPSVVGIVTAGHVIGKYDFCYYKGRTFGECTESNKDFPKADAAFVEPINTWDTYILTNFIRKANGVLTPVVNAPLAGSIVDFCGADTLGSGLVISTNYVLFGQLPSGNSIPLITDLATATYVSKGGDSGGIIFGPHPHTTPIKPQMVTIGTHLGRDTLRKVAIFSKAQNVLDALEIERY